LKEGKSWTVDVGARGTHGGVVSWDASYFVMQFEDQIGTSGNTVDNVGDAVHHGLEFAAEADLVGLADRARGTALRDRIGSVSPFVNVLALDDIENRVVNREVLREELKAMLEQLDSRDARRRDDADAPAPEGS